MMNAGNFQTKAENLARIRGKLKTASVMDLVFFTAKEWNDAPENIISKIQTYFKEDLLIVRSSAIGEDGISSSHAGKYTTCLGIRRTDSYSLADSINRVISSFPTNPENQVLVQPMLTSVQTCGVMMTCNHPDGAQYYVINYDDTSGKTDGVTSGTTINKTVYVLRSTPLYFVKSPRLLRILLMAKELEHFFKSESLDIEFAVDTDHQPYVFQVRPITLRRNDERINSGLFEAQLSIISDFVNAGYARGHRVLGKRTIYGIMPDWNPAEMIGKTPARLAYSLYRHLITRNVWATARYMMGYRDLSSEELMVMLAGHPYIDIRNSFNSFLPSDLDDETGEKLVDLWLDRLVEYPALHDKVEFAIVTTCYDFSFRKKNHERYCDTLSEEELLDYEIKLRKLTINCLNLSKEGTLRYALSHVRELDKLQQKREPVHSDGTMENVLGHIRNLLNECIESGTTPFAVIARHAFIAEALFQSAIQCEAISSERYNEFKQCVPLITADFAEDYRKVLSGSQDKDIFLRRYGHLRPGTYDILSLRYADRGEIFDPVGNIPHVDIQKGIFHLTADEETRLNELLLLNQFSRITSNDLLQYTRSAISGREYAKFIFSRNISDVLELLKIWGKDLDLTCDDLAHLDIEDILSLPATTPAALKKILKQKVAEGKIEFDLARQLRLGHLIRDTRDLYIIPLLKSLPNFCGSGLISGPVHLLDSGFDKKTDLRNKIVCILSADPGYDWIFTQKIKGLITQYGGINSHMTIRCAEYGIPAAIGCGEQLFERILEFGGAELDCDKKTIRPLIFRRN